VNYYGILTKVTGVTVGASNDRTGNIKYGGDWVMESTNQDIELIYFTQTIEYYQFLLDTGLFTLAILSNGTIYGCGANIYGQLGNKTNADSDSLVQMISMPTNKTPLWISSGTFYTIVLMTDGTIYGCGENIYGQLGNGLTVSNSSLVQMTLPANKTPTAISCGGSHTIVLMTDGTIYGCGSNSYGQLGNGSTGSTISSLVQMTSVPNKTPAAISCGAYYTIVRMTDGTIYGCGANSNGQLGNGSTGSNSSLVQMTLPANKTPAAISCGGSHTIVLMTDGTIYGCGENFFGQLGNGSIAFIKSSLVQMTSVSNKTPAAISCGGSHTIVRMTDGTIYGCGYNNDGQLGNGSSGPTQNTNSSLVQMTLPSNQTPVATSCGAVHTIVRMTDGTIYGCGNNNNGQLGIGNQQTKTLLTPMTNTYSPNIVIRLPNEIVPILNNTIKIPTQSYLIGQPTPSHLNRNTLSGRGAMPVKDSTSDGTNSFSMDRRNYQRTLDQNPATNTINPNIRSLSQNPFGMFGGQQRMFFSQSKKQNTIAGEGPRYQAQKKWMGGSGGRDASQIATKRRVNSVGNGSLNSSNGQISFMSRFNPNTNREALIHVRDQGPSVQTKVRGRNLRTGMSVIS
jgi:alpha-tubulin suppressor-like RCC1 family protein